MEISDIKSIEHVLYAAFAAFSLAFSIFAREKKQTLENEVADFISSIKGAISVSNKRELVKSISFQERSRYIMFIILIFFILQFFIFCLTFVHDELGLIQSDCTEHLLFSHILFLFVFSFIAFLLEFLNSRKTSKARKWFD